MKRIETRAFLLGLLVGGALIGCGDAKPPIAPPLPSAVPSAAPTPTPSTSADMPKQPTTNVGKATSDETARGIKALQSGDLTTAKANLEAALKKNPKDAEALFYLGATLDKGGDRAGAEKAYKDALTIKPDLEEAAANLGALYVDMEKYDDAIKLLKSAIAKRPDDAPLRTNLALAMAGKGDKDGARKAFDEAVKIAPSDASLLLAYGHWLGEWKDHDGALQKLRAARAAAGDNVGVLAGVGHELHVLNAISDCVPTFDKAISLKDAAELRTERAACKAAAKDEAGALADLQAATAKEPSYAPAHYYLGNSYARQNKWDDAIKEYEAYLKLQPTGPLAKSVQDKITLAKQRKAGGGAPKK